jgi:glycosyltransferase involved in cell wall biosynthesis
MQKKKILYIHHSTGIGGAPISLIEVIKALPPEEFDAEVLILKRSDVCDLFDAAAIKYKIANHWFYERWYLPYAHIEVGWVKIFQPLKFIYFSFSWLFSRLFGAHSLLADFQADIVHLNSYALTDFLCAASKKAKTVIHVREPATRGHFGLRKRVMNGQIRKYADEIVAISQDNLARLNMGNRGHVVYNSVSPAVFSTSLPSSKPNSVVYLGGISLHKGFLTLAAASEMISPTIHVKVLGYVRSGLESNFDLRKKFKQSLKWLISSDYRKMLLALEKIRALKNFEIVGIVKNPEKHIEDSRLLLNLFTVTHFSRPIIESYAVGRGVIATNVAGIGEIVEVGETGFLAATNDPKALAGLINRVVPDNDLLDRIGRNGRELAATRFSSANVQKLVEIYKRLFMGS